MSTLIYPTSTSDSSPDYQFSMEGSHPNSPDLTDEMKTIDTILAPLYDYPSNVRPTISEELFREPVIYVPTPHPPSSTAQVKREKNLPSGRLSRAESPESPQMSEDEESHTKGKRRSDKTRSEQTREASKRYREKKKKISQQMESKVEALQREKQDLLNTHELALKTIRSLNMELTALQNKTLEDQSQYETRRRGSLDELECALRESSSDEVIKGILEKLKSGRQNGPMSGSHWSLMIAPSAVQQITSIGFFNEITGKTKIDEVNGIGMFASNILLRVSSIVPEQKGEITTIVKKYYQDMATIRSERDQLNRDITSFFPSIDPANAGKTIEQISMLELLRFNLAAEEQLWAITIDAVMNTLSIRQQAQFFLETEFHYKNILHLKTIYESLRKNHS
eukprot:TRINITY_DN2021_c0_g1_i1.p1 TRINITY_DN2021_c0_g1~~TRINITY_DN2021_c0_g1_i1.p1  ORF type:complete len:395 (-),score=82.30 TRINITY_DN2021_c0_g1_i1:233-1417(-)